MKGFAGILVLAVLSALLGSAALFAGFYQREMAAADENFLMQEYDAARERLAAAEHYAGYGRWLPPLVRRPLADVRTREAAANYWQQRYDAVLPRQADPVGAVDVANPDLQLI